MPLCLEKRFKLFGHKLKPIVCPQRTRNSKLSKYGMDSSNYLRTCCGLRDGKFEESVEIIHYHQDPNRSALISCQGAVEGTKRGIGSGAPRCPSTWQQWHALHNVSTSLWIFGRQTLLHDLVFVLTIPWRPSWAILRTLSRRILEINILIPGSKSSV